VIVRTQITLDAETHRRAKLRAADLGISFAEYVRRTLDRDLGERPKTNISTIFGLFDSGVSDVSSNVDKHLGESLRNRARAQGPDDPIGAARGALASPAFPEQYAAADAGARRRGCIGWATAVSPVACYSTVRVDCPAWR
jgi:hypothetical protein